MKKELYDLLVWRIMTQSDLYSTHTVTIKEGLEVHCFGNVKNTDLAEAKALFKQKGYKASDVHEEAEILRRIGKLQNQYLTILYGRDTDKISISTFEMGYDYAYNKQRYYPLKKNYPVLAYTKKMYGFKYMKKNKCDVRILLGKIHLMGFSSALEDIITKTMLGIEYIPEARISYRHFINTKSDIQAMSNYFGIRIPEALKIFPVEEVMSLYRTIKDFNQINKLCQFIAKGNTKAEFPDPFTIRGTERRKMNLYQTIAKMLFDNHNDDWLIRDTVADCIKLKKKTLSLAVTSKRRWQDEHQKAAKLRMLLGIPELTVKEDYKKALEGIEYPYELIETKERLVQESMELHHCVATYAEKINRGQCAIFSIEFEGKRYTLEVSAQKYNNGVAFKSVQFRGLSNQSAPEEISKHVAKILHSNSCSALDRKEIILEATVPQMMELDF